MKLDIARLAEVYCPVCQRPAQLQHGREIHCGGGHVAVLFTVEANDPSDWRLGTAGSVPEWFRPGQWVRLLPSLSENYPSGCEGQLYALPQMDGLYLTLPGNCQVRVSPQDVEPIEAPTMPVVAASVLPRGGYF